MAVSFIKMLLKVRRIVSTQETQKLPIVLACSKRSSMVEFLEHFGRKFIV